MAVDWVLIAQWVGWVLLALAIVYVVWKFYQTRADFTYMTHNDQGFRRALRGRGVIWDPEEFVVKGSSAPRIEFVALDPASGQRKMSPLMNTRTGAVNLRPQYCVPLPFTAITADNHKLMVEARVQFSINRDRMFFVYHVQDFALALETRIQGAVRSEIGKREDQILRASLQSAEADAVKSLRQAEDDGDEAHEAGMALGVNFHTLNFTFTKADEFSELGMPTGVGAGGPVPVTAEAANQAMERARTRLRSGVLSFKPTQVDELGDIFKTQTPASTAALLAMFEMQTRQNVAEALAASGQLMVLTPQELGFVAGAAARDAMARRADAAAPTPSAPGAANGGARPEARI